MYVGIGTIEIKISFTHIINQKFCLNFKGREFYVPCIRSVYHFLVHIWFRISRYDNGIYCKVNINRFLVHTNTNNSNIQSLHDFRGLRSKHLTRLEHQLAENIKATQSRIWNGVTKDVSYLRRILNEVYMMKFKVCAH